ncbi:MAG: hypothetical protein OEV49_06630 [candidate division Zixibacteria bacterium]|nr:hypothetical protein [candidate division Zixibacteria bacterium]MDH3937356.1 hypothetical protein [candidate division Zixibacteria bacterium]MDH4035840.1 hypothetical protein [candidate division Zixibacteria bacterium]
MFSNRHILRRYQIASLLVVSIIVGGFQPAFAQPGVTNVIYPDPSFSTGMFKSVIINSSAIPGADVYEVCFFDSADTENTTCAVLTPAGRDALAADLEDVVEGRIYGCFIRAHFDQNGKTACSDTLFLTGEATTHCRVIANNARKSLGAYDAAGAQSVTRAHNYPNPFNPKEEDTRIVFESGGGGSVTILIYDLFGNLVYEENDVDTDDLRWEGRNGRGELVGSGGYICLLKVGDSIVSKHKIAVIK